MSDRVAAAYEACRGVARASGTSFYRGMSLLPATRRDAMFAVYALARRIDDVADGNLPRDEKLARLAEIRASLAELDASDDPVLVAVADAARRFPIPLSAFGDLVDGAEMDVHGRSYETFADLELYCRRVAGSIGRLSVGVLETRDGEAADPLADDLGVALQLGNILRDLDEDLRQGRVYLPAEDLARFGVSVKGGSLAGPASELLVAFEAERALGWLRRGLELLPLLSRRRATTVRAMAGSYGYLLERIARDPSRVLGRRPSLRPWEKGWVLVRSVVALPS